MIAFLIFFYGHQVAGQSAGDSLVNFKLRKKVVIAGNALGYATLMSGLYQLWYKDFPLSSFHFINDNASWLQMDKIGHIYSSYYEGLLGKEMMQWAGYNHRTSTIIGGSYGFAVQLGIEVFDGFSEEWGASWGDLLSNGIGSGLFIGQELLWKEQRMIVKFAFAPTDFAPIRPDIFGVSFAEQMMKDYNGQTYWLSLNPHSFMKPENKFPKWLNVAFGYGANGMIGGSGNVFQKNGITYDYRHIERQRQFYLSPDIDFSKIPTKSKALKICFRILNGIKMPLPTLEFRQNDRFRFHLLYF
jgi:uncharacterized protein YfiM (DUF2279 family)